MGRVGLVRTVSKSIGSSIAILVVIHASASAQDDSQPASHSGKPNRSADSRSDAPMSKDLRVVRVIDTPVGPVAQEVPVYSSKATAEQIGRDQYHRAASALNNQMSAMNGMIAELEATAPQRAAALAKHNAGIAVWNHAFAARRNGCLVEGGSGNDCYNLAMKFANAGHIAGEPGTYPLMPGVEVRALKDKMACLDEQTLAMSKSIPTGNDPDSKRQRRLIDKACVKITQGSLINFTKAIPAMHRLEITYEFDELEKTTFSSFLSNRINETKKIQRVYITEDSDFETSDPGYRGDLK